VLNLSPNVGSTAIYILIINSPQPETLSSEPLTRAVGGQVGGRQTYLITRIDIMINNQVIVLGLQVGDK